MRHKPGRRFGNAPPIASNPAASQRVNFQIGRLTMEGYAPGEHKRFTQSLQSRLRDLVTVHGTPGRSAGLRMNRLDVGRLSAGVSPEELARQIAQQIFSKIRRETGGSDHV